MRELILFLIPFIFICGAANFIKKMTTSDKILLKRDCEYKTKIPELLLKQEILNLSNPIGAEERIVNGKNARRGQFPYIAFLDFNKGEWSCSAVFIAPTYLLGAQHCFRHPRTPFISTIDVLAGGVCRKADESQGCPDSDLQKFSVDYIFMDSRTLGEDWQYDLAVIKLEEPVAIDQFLTFACITKKTRLFEHETVTMAGYGLLTMDRSDNEDITSRLQFLSLMDQVTAEEMEENIHPEENSDFNKERLFGILGDQPSQSGAPGDSGTGILYKESPDEKSYQLIGIYLGAVNSQNNSTLGIALNMEYLVRDLCKVIELCIEEEEIMESKHLPNAYLNWDTALIRKSDARNHRSFNENSFKCIGSEAFEEIQMKCSDPINGPSMEEPQSHFLAAIVKKKTGEIICGLTILTHSHGISLKACFINNRIIVENHDDMVDQPDMLDVEIMVGRVEFNGADQREYVVKENRRIPIKRIGWRLHDPHHKTADTLVMLEYIDDAEAVSGLCFPPSDVKDTIFHSAIFWKDGNSVSQKEHFSPQFFVQGDEVDKCDLCKNEYLNCMYRSDYCDDIPSNTVSESSYGGPVMDREKKFITGIIVDTKSCPSLMVTYDASALYNDACFYFGLCPAEDHFVLLSINAVKTIEYN